MNCIVINARKDEYAAKEVTGTMTVRQLIEYLEQFNPSTPIMVGNDPQGGSFGWYTYGEITRDQIYEYTEEDEEEDEYEEDE